MTRAPTTCPACLRAAYTLKIELSGFRTYQHENVLLRVDSVTRTDAEMALGGVAETVTVTEATPIINTTDASVGQTMSRETIARAAGRRAQRGAPAQPAARRGLHPHDERRNTTDPRYGSVAGARADQQNVTLDGVDVNDPQLQAAYTTAVRMTQEALQEFRVSTSNYGAEAGRSSGPQVSLVTRSGTNEFNGSGYWLTRRTATSSNEYFLKLSQVLAGSRASAPKLDKDIVRRVDRRTDQAQQDVLLRQLRERCGETARRRSCARVPSDSFRDGVLLYQCAVASACPGGSASGIHARRTPCPPAGTV